MGPEQTANARLEIFNAIQEKWVPHTVALGYFQQVYPQFADFWLFRRQFSYQMAALTFMTYILYMHNRYPQKINIARGSGNVWGLELMSYMSSNKPFFHNPEAVPFRLTPNLQTLMGPLATEGIFASSIMAIARCLTEPEHELEHALTLFVRDEMIFWFTSSHRNGISDSQLRESAAQHGFHRQEGDESCAGAQWESACEPDCHRPDCQGSQPDEPGTVRRFVDAVSVKIARAKQG